jgi:hypothetical protein
MAEQMGDEMGTIGDKTSRVLLSVMIVTVQGLLLSLIPFAVFFLSLTWTGEVLRCLFTLGHHRPVWNLHSIKSFSGLGLMAEISMYLGVAFWLLVAVLIRHLI